MKLYLKSMFSALLLTGTLLLSGCESFLDETPDKTLAVPAALGDLQAILDYVNTMNQNNPAGSAETSADNYYLPATTWDAMSNEGERRKYIWAKDDLFRRSYSPNHWYNCYQTIYAANTVLENVARIPRTPANSRTWDNVRGQASYYRAEALLWAAFIWAPAYDPGTADRELGLPLRLGTNFNESLTRSTVQQTYDQVLEDLKAATRLPENAPHVMRPARPAAYALLARALLSMRRYEEAGAYADSSLALYDRLLDYAALSSSPTYPMPAFNVEVLHHSSAGGPQSLTINNARVDTLLYRMYADDDLRKTLFFRRNADGTHSFRGSYAGSSSHFAGTASNEVYLMQAECRARAGDVAGAMESLNQLLRTRWRPGTYTDHTAVSPAEALHLVLQERRKELLFRGLRWMDIKRLNLEGANISLVRRLGNQTYTLPAGDLRFALPLPEDVIDFSGMQQNPR